MHNIQIEHYQDRIQMMIHKEIFGIAFITADLGKPISFDRVDITKSIRISDEHEKIEQ